MKVLETYMIFENMQQAKKTLKELHIDETNPDFLRLKEMLKKSPGYLGKFTDWLFRDHTEFDQLESVYNKLREIKIDKPLTDFKTAEELFDYFQKFEIDKKVRHLINALPSRTRAYVTDDLKKLLSMNLKYYDQIRDLYFNKGGREIYKNSEKLYKDTQTVIENNSGAFNLETILEKIKGKHLEIHYQTPNLLMCRILDYETSCEIGSPHWCIVTDKSYWNQYVDGSTQQYFIWDFTKNVSDKKHMMGVTMGMGTDIKDAFWADDTTVQNPRDVLEEYE